MKIRHLLLLMCLAAASATAAETDQEMLDRHLKSCEEGDMTRCSAIGVLRAAQGRLIEAIPFLSKPCEAGEKIACEVIEAIGELEEFFPAGLVKLYSRHCKEGIHAICNNQSANALVPLIKSCEEGDSSACTNVIFKCLEEITIRMIELHAFERFLVDNHDKLRAKLDELKEEEGK